ncbi:endo-beta-N-acetylglucosaminidase [Streptomyces sp. MST-110588]|uniref:endo-beta-N-acetylglucosaminidase n=1 Tax=Streptomyces sp. MST-110588 TaxID=2833628 RepID=UPI001F5CB87B|nr:endo-beta-N-acetylglucosaminidase [Streptomyces sp. MST-110588]UNO44081.1 endo-beta-N-acetylglucosaminidase [Streptomyces sp. MST-110588]
MAGAVATATVLPLAGPAAPAPVPARGPAPAAPAASLQPYASYWFPDSFPEGRQPDPGAVWRSLKTWRPQDDPDLPYNTATVPLAERFTPVPATPTARRDQARVTALVSFAGTAANPSQGVPSADYYALTHWAFLEELVFWGGSSGEGVILAPNAPVVDAAHRNGVRVLGTVFLPPAAFGGDLKWTRELVQRDSLGRFPLAGKLVQVARTYGFDGWFLNAETDGGDAQLARDVADFLQALRAAAPELRITWYDALNADGRVGWQGALNDRNAMFLQRGAGKVSDTMFVDFRWSAARLASSAAHARRLGRSPYELWAGVDVEANGWGTGVDWEAIVPGGRDHVVSYGFYRPEWTRRAGEAPGRFHDRDDRFWCGQNTDPSAPAGPGAWQPPARHVADRSTVTAVPFACSFSTGHGTDWYENGVRTGEGGWSHLALQDRLPGRRWSVRTRGARPQVALDFDAAWRGGSSLLVEGDLSDGPVTLELFRTRLPLREGTVLELVHRTEAGSAPVTVTAAVAHHEPKAAGTPPDMRFLPVKAVRTVAGWTTSAVRIGGGAARTACVLGVRLEAPEGGGGARWRLGALAVHDGAPGKATPAPPRGLTVAARRDTGRDTAELRLTWRAAARRTGPVPRHYEVHQLLPDGARRFLGGTCGTALYIPAVRRTAGERATRLEVRAVGELYTSSAPVPAVVSW